MAVIGCSAGGIEVLSQLLSGLTVEPRPAIAIVQHIKAGPQNNLGQHFARLCACPVQEIEDKVPIEAGHIYFAPPDYHILVGDDGQFHLSVEPPVRFARPSIDVLFESAAEIYGKRLLAVVLTGSNDDGTNGARHVIRYGGRLIVQDPAEASFPTMPAAALVACPKAEVMKSADIGDVLRGIR